MWILKPYIRRDRGRGLSLHKIVPFSLNLGNLFGPSWFLGISCWFAPNGATHLTPTPVVLMSFATPAAWIQFFGSYVDLSKEGSLKNGFKMAIFWAESSLYNTCLSIWNIQFSSGNCFFSFSLGGWGARLRRRIPRAKWSTYFHSCVFALSGDFSVQFRPDFIPLIDYSSISLSLINKVHRGGGISSPAIYSWGNSSWFWGCCSFCCCGCLSGCCSSCSRCYSCSFFCCCLPGRCVIFRSRF